MHNDLLKLIYAIHVRLNEISGNEFYYLKFLFEIIMSHRKTSESCSNETNSDCNYTAPIDLLPNVISFDVTSIGKI